MESERIEMQKSLVNEISKGMGQVKQVKVSSTLDKEQERFLERMLSSYEEALFILTGRAPQGGQCQSGIAPSSNPPAPSSSVPKQEGARKTIVSRVERRKYKTNAEGAAGDGYSWRKYGKKHTKGSIYPRNYFKCRGKGCPAKKHEDRSKDDPATIHVTYGGVHTCLDKSPSSTMGIIEQDQTFSFPSPTDLNVTTAAALERYYSVDDQF